MGASHPLRRALFEAMAVLLLYESENVYFQSEQMLSISLLPNKGKTEAANRALFFGGCETVHAARMPGNSSRLKGMPWLE